MATQDITETIDGLPIYTIAEKMPQFKYEENIHQYIFQNIKLDSLSDDERLQTKINVSFVIDTIGNIREVKILNPKYPNKLTKVEKEFIRVIYEMPKWTPATNADKKVAVRLQYPININLNN